MSTFPIGDDELGNDFLGGDNVAASLGRISGPMLKANLERNGIDLSFETDLLYLNVTDNRIGIRKDNPSYDVDVNDTIRTKKIIIDNQGKIDNVLLNSPNQFSTLIGPLDVRTVDLDQTFFHYAMETSDLRFDQNIISSFNNLDINFDPSGTGTFELQKSTHITGDVSVGGNITLDGDLKAGDNIIVGDSPLDVATIIPEFSADLIPATNNIYDLGTTSLRWRNAYSNTLKNATSARIANILIQSPATFNTTTGSLFVNATGPNQYSLFEKVETANLIINDNYISSKSNSNIRFDPFGTGTVNLMSSTEVTGNVTVSGNIVVNGDLRPDGDIIIGDQPLDTVTINTDFTQSIIPGADNTYDLGKRPTLATQKRWNTLVSDNWETVGTFYPQSVTVSDQTRIDGVNNKISGLQSNEDMVLLPDTGITYIERTKWQDNDITNLNNTPLTIAGTGRGYLSIIGTNAVVIPSGDNSQRRSIPELGETRWNTELGYMECWDGTQWNIATGGGAEVTQVLMEDLSYVWNLILG